MANQNNRSSGFTLGLIFGLLVGFVLAVLIYKNNPKTFSKLADRLNQLIKDLTTGSKKTFPSSPKTSSPSNKTIASAKPRPRRRPKTFVRSRS